MKEIIKSKLMLGFIVFVLGFSYVDSINQKNLDGGKAPSKSDLMVMNTN